MFGCGVCAQAQTTQEDEEVKTESATKVASRDFKECFKLQRQIDKANFQAQKRLSKLAAKK